MLHVVTKISKKYPLIRAVLLLGFSLQMVGMPSAEAQIALPAPGTMVSFSTSFTQASIKGIVVYPRDPFKLDFILDQGDKPMGNNELQKESQKLVEYFLAALTTPQKDIWVNLSPYERERIVPNDFGKTVMGQDLLAQDYLLKQIMATALYPQRELGQAFWAKIYKEAQDKFGTSNIKVDTFNKVWVVPNKAVVYKNAKMNTVMITEATLKVMLEQDYTAMKAAGPAPAAPTALASQIIKAIVIPALEKEVNEGKNFSPLRQVYHSLILAKWFKESLTQNVLSKGYANRNKVEGVKGVDEALTQKIYGQYLKAYRKGVFNFIEEDIDPVTLQVIPRKYFSGGFMGGDFMVEETTAQSKAMLSGFLKRSMLKVMVVLSLISPWNMVYAQGGGEGAAVIESFPRALTPAPAGGGISIPVNSADVLNTIGATVNGGGDPRAAAQAFKNMNYFDAVAAQYAAQILRLSSGSGADASIGVSFSFPWGITIEGLGSSLAAGINALKAQSNVGNSTLRMQAAAYLARFAPQLSDSSIFEMVFARGSWESLTNNNEKDSMVRAAKLVALTSILKAGRETRWSNGITGMDFVEESLKSPNPIERMAAIAFLQAVRTGDLDRRYQGLIIEAIGKANLPELSGAASAARKQEMATAVAPLIQRFKELFANKAEAENYVGFNNWYLQMKTIMASIVELSQENQELLIQALRTLSDNLTAADATEVVNSVYLGTLYENARRGGVQAQLYIEELNRFRAMAGLSPVPAVGISFGRPNDIVSALRNLSNGINPAENARIVVEDGGPAYTSALISVLRLSPNSDTVVAILKSFKLANDNGAFGRSGVIEQSIIRIIDSNDPFDSMPIDMIEGLVQSGIAVSTGVVRKLVSYTLRQTNTVSSSVNLGQSMSQQTIINIARIINNSGRADEARRFINTVPKGMEAGSNGARLLVMLAHTGRTSVTAGGVGAPVFLENSYGWQGAEKAFLAYVESGTNLQNAINSLKNADSTYRSASDPSAGRAIMEKISKEPRFQSSEHKKRMADVFAGIGDIGFDFLVGLLNSGYLDVDLYVLDLLGKSGAKQRATAADAILGTFIFWLEKRSLENPQSRAALDQITEKIVTVGRILGVEEMKKAIGLKLNVSGPINHLVLKQLSEWVTGSAIDPKAILGPYSQLLNVVRDPSSTPPQLLSALTALSRLTVAPAWAWGDWNNTAYHFQDPNVRVSLIGVSGQITKLLGPALASIEEYQKRADAFLAEFKATRDPRMMAHTANSFTRMPSEYSGYLFWEAVKDLKVKFPNYAGDLEEQRLYFALLGTMKDLILAAGPVKEGIVGFIGQKLKLQFNNTNNRYDDPELVFFAAALGVDIKSLPIGFTTAVHADLRESPKPLSFTTLEQARESIDIRQALASLLDQYLPALISSSGVPIDPLRVLQNITSRLNPKQQLTAMAGMGDLLPLLPVMNITLDDPKAETVRMYLVSQLSSDRGDDKRFIQQWKNISKEAMVIYARTLVRSSDSRMKGQLIEIIKSDAWMNNPAAMKEIIDAIGLTGDASAVDPLLEFFFRHKMQRYWPWGDFNHVLGEAVENALKDIAKRYKTEVEKAFTAYKERLKNRGWFSSIAPVWYFDGTWLTNGLKGNVLKDSALVAIPGGIDLEKTTVQSIGDVDMGMAVTDDEQLTYLIQAQGLIVRVKDIKPLTVPMINGLLGVSP